MVKKKPNLVNVVCERPLTEVTLLNNFTYCVEDGGVWLLYPEDSEVLR